MCSLLFFTTKYALSQRKIDEAPADPDGDAPTPLRIACELGHRACVEQLLDAGAAVDRLSHGVTALGAPPAGLSKMRLVKSITIKSEVCQKILTEFR